MRVIRDIPEQSREAGKGYRLSLEGVLQQSFNILRMAPAEFILYSILALFVFSNPVSAWILGGPVSASYLHMAHRVRKEQKIEQEDYFKGFERFRDFFILQTLIFVVVTLGLALLILPGIYLSVSYVFAHAYALFYRTSPTEAMRLSRLLVSGNFGQILLLLLILGAINLLGFLAFGLGILLSMPFSFCVIYVVFNDMISIDNLNY